MDLRPYQKNVIDQIYAEWKRGARNVCVQLATGGGKTVIMSRIIADTPLPSIAIAHRMELVSQISLTLARHGIRHNLIAQKPAIREIVRLHMQEVGRSYYDQYAIRSVAGVDTLIRMPEETSWFKTVMLVVQDEGHHPLRNNKWGSVADFFPNARGLYPTATPIRADGKGLGRHADGIMDSMVVGVSMRELIRSGYLTDYRIFAPPSDIDLSTVPITASGDFSSPKLREATHKSHITGDVVAHYLKIAPGKLGVTFAVDIEAATKIATEFRQSGIPAEVISSKTPDLLRSQIMRRFKNREILQLVNVDLLGEGVDVPAIEVVSMARSTASYGLYSQQFGRALRPLAGKTHAIIIDHVNNVLRHGLPDAPRMWSLDRRDKRARSTPNDAIPLRSCLQCFNVFPRSQRLCPHCGFYSQPQSRSTPESVDGDLCELDPQVLQRLRGEIDRIDNPPRIPGNASEIVAASIAKNHRLRQAAQTELRQSVAQWAGYLKADNKDDSEICRIFYFKFGIDIATAQTLGVRDAEDLTHRIETDIHDIDKSRNRG